MSGDSFSWKRFRQAVKDVLLPWRGAKKMLGQVAAWAAWIGVAGATAFTAITRDDILPPSWHGQVLLSGLLLLIGVLGVRAAYRLRTQLDNLAGTLRSERDEQRRRVVVASHKLIASFTAFRLRLVQNVPVEEAQSAVQGMKSDLSDYKEACDSLALEDAVIHARLQAELESALGGHDVVGVSERMQPPIEVLIDYCGRFGFGSGLDQDEARAVADWFTAYGRTATLAQPAAPNIPAQDP